MKLNRKLWTAALAVAMTTPSAMAAQDTAGMQYTSASEGFYASIRVRFNANGGTKDGGANIGNSGSRFGIRGTNDLGGGLEGFYQYEMGVSTENGNKDMSTRVGVVGLRGDFGEFAAGSFWTNSYNWVYGSTDIANVASGNFAYGPLGQGRSKNSIQYTTPDLNGFQGAILIKADSSSDGEGSISDNPTVTPSMHEVVDTGGATLTLVLATPGEPANPKDDNDIDHWTIAAKYDIAGFSTAFSFSRDVDSLDDGTSDKDGWAAKIGYSQDNWYVNSWYGQHDDNRGYDDFKYYSLASGVSVEKVSVYGMYEIRKEDFGDAGNEDDSYTTLGVQYNLGSRSRVWVEYAGADKDSDSTADDDFTIGLRHDF